MKNFLIVNLTRMGDLIQTTPVLRGIKEIYPEAVTTLMVNSDFEGIIPFLPGVDRVFPVNIRDIVFQVDGGEIVEAYRSLKALLDTVNETVYDRVINFTHSLDSAVMTSMIRARETRGVSIDEKGYSIKPDPWIRYFFNVIPSRTVNPFHLCDMHLKVAGVDASGKGLSLQVERDELDRMRERLFRAGVREGDRLVGLQLGASAEDKRWPVESFGLLGRMLKERNGVKVVITGASSERKFGKEFQQCFGKDCINMIGSTSLAELVSLIHLLDLYISNDTGPLHIATAVGTTTINISLASVYFRETGPYSEGDYVIKADISCSPCGFQSDCRKNLCKELIKPELLWRIADAVLRGEEFAAEPEEEWRDVQVYRSFFDRDGMVHYRPLVRKKLSREALFTHLYRMTWRAVLDGLEMPEWERTGPGLLERLDCWYESDNQTLLGESEEDRLALREIRDLATAALRIVDVIGREGGKETPDPYLLRELWENIKYMNGEIELRCMSRPMLRSLLLIFRYGMESLAGERIDDLAGEAREQYSDLKRHAESLLGFFDWLERCTSGEAVTACGGEGERIVKENHISF